MRHSLMAAGLLSLALVLPAAAQTTIHSTSSTTTSTAPANGDSSVSTHAKTGAGSVSSSVTTSHRHAVKKRHKVKTTVHQSGPGMTSATTSTTSTAPH
jgi:hypothetical protein